MMAYSSFAEMEALAGKEPPSRLCVAGGNDPGVIEAVIIALRKGLISEAIITGDAASIRAAIPAELAPKLTLIGAGEPGDCARLAVRKMREGEADILMKGHIDSTSYLRAIVDRESGIRQGGTLSNVTVAEMPSFPKLIAATDNGIIPLPTLEQKRQIILNSASLFRGLGREPVKVAALAATEKISPKLPATMDAAALKEECTAGAFPGFLIDGPFGYDVAVSKAAARAKNLGASMVAGEADLLLFQSIEAANAVAKSWKFHGEARTGSIVLGARMPVLLNSRSDSPARRINALLLAIAVRAGRKHLNTRHDRPHQDIIGRE